MTDSMIERVAIAMQENLHPQEPLEPRELLDAARAAIAAMRVPTAAMSAAGGKFWPDVTEHQAECIYGEMINAALADVPK